MFPSNDLCLLFHYSSSCFHALTVVFHAHSSRMMLLSFKCISEGQPLHQTLKSEHTNKKVRKVHSVLLWRVLKALSFQDIVFPDLCSIHMLTRSGPISEAGNLFFQLRHVHELSSCNVETTWTLQKWVVFCPRLVAEPVYSKITKILFYLTYQC